MNMILIDSAYAAELAETESTVSGANESVAASLGLNPTLFVSQLIDFALVAAVLWFLILKPLTKKMAERQKLIDESLDNAKKVQENLANSEKQYQEKLDVAKIEANKLIEKAAADAQEASLQIKNKAKQEIEMLVENAKKNISIEKTEMISEVKKQAADLVITALEKILSEKVTDAKDKTMIAEMMKKMK